MEMYAEAENMLVWEDAAIAPIYWYTRVNLTKPYIVRTYGLGNKQAFHKWDVLPH